MKLYYTIDEIVKEDKKWRNLANKISNDKLQADEILHTFYAYYLEMPTPPIINYTYIYQALYNNYVQTQIKLGKRIEYDEDAEPESDHNNIYDEVGDFENENLYKNILLDIEGLDYFNRTLFKLNMIDGMPIRKIQKEYKLSYSTIQKSISKTKLLLKNKYTDNEKE